MRQHLNLMSARARRREAFRVATRKWSRVLALAVLIVLPLGTYRWWKCDQVRRRAEAAELQYEPVRRMRTESNRLRRQIESIVTAQRVPLTLAEPRPVLGLIGLAGSCVQQLEGAVFLEALEFQQEPLADADGGPVVAALELYGTARDSDAVTKLADSLREVGPFAQVEADARESGKAEVPHARTFTIECTF